MERCARRSPPEPGQRGGGTTESPTGAQLIACKTRFFDTQLAAIYDYLLDLVETKGLRIVATNSYGIPVGAAPPPPGAVFMEALDDAIRGGVAVVFSAGNYHELAGGQASDCGPTSIWQYKCRADILSVATCKLDRTMWSYSSRGPGDLAGGSGMSEKPDVTAPTPENGAVLYGDSIKVLANGWGTSGAAPQAAGLAALLLSHRPQASTSDVFEVIRGTAVPLGRSHECEGSGMIDCKAALDA